MRDATTRRKVWTGAVLAGFAAVTIASLPVLAGGKKKIHLEVTENGVHAEYKARMASREPGSMMKKFKVEVSGMDLGDMVVFQVDVDGDGVPECTFDMDTRRDGGKDEARLVFKGNGPPRMRRHPMSHLDSCDPRGSMLSITGPDGTMIVSPNQFPEMPGSGGSHDGDMGGGHDGDHGGGMGGGEGDDHGMNREEMEIQLAPADWVSMAWGRAEYRMKKGREAFEVEIRDVESEGPWTLWTCDEGETGDACTAWGELRMKRRHGSFKGKAKYRTPARGGHPELVEDPHGRRIEVRDADGMVGFQGDFPMN